MQYHGQVVEDVEGALGDSDVHGVFGADVDGCARLGEDDKVISRHGALVLHRVVLHLPCRTKDQNYCLNMQNDTRFVVYKMLNGLCT